MLELTQYPGAYCGCYARGKMAVREMLDLFFLPVPFFSIHIVVEVSASLIKISLYVRLEEICLIFLQQ